MLAGFLLIAALLSWAALRGWLVLERYVEQSRQGNALALQYHTLSGNYITGFRFDYLSDGTDNPLAWDRIGSIAFDADKAQTAVQELSRLLRHVLYDNQQNFVTLDKEMDFIRNYIELMRIRLSANVRVETKIDVRPDSRTEIAPLIFISLIENAFKHGISPTEPSFIRIHFSESPGEIHCEITNSYHPKSVADKSGSGIGLEQVRKRLELTYPGHYDWQQGVSEDMKEYKSILIIKI